MSTNQRKILVHSVGFIAGLLFASAVLALGFVLMPPLDLVGGIVAAVMISGLAYFSGAVIARSIVAAWLGETLLTEKQEGGQS